VGVAVVIAVESGELMPAGSLASETFGLITPDDER
jgi:hypothetical protein